MRNRLVILSIAVAVVLVSCSRHEAVPTGSYGERVVAGQVVMASEVANSTPAGVEVSVVGTGMTATLAADGRFTFIGVPDNAELRFRRADGIDARVRVPSGAPLVVELSGTTAMSSHSRRRGVSPKDPGPSQQIEGLIQTASGDSIVVLDSHQQVVTVAIDASTLIRKGDQFVQAGALAAGDRVHVKALVINDVLTALQIIVQNESAGDDGGDNEGGTTMTANGPVKSVDGTTLVVTSQPKGDVTVNTDASTIIRKQGQIVTTADIRVGDEVNCLGTRVDDHTLLARQIEVRGNSKHN